MTHTVFLSNRSIHREKSKGNSLFGNGFNKENTNRLAIAEPLEVREVYRRRIGPKRRLKKYEKVKRTYQLTLQESGSEAEVLRSIAADDNGRPWVLFLHGNNQTLEKNLSKSRSIQDKYNVNMIIYSWPSRSYKDFVVPFLLGGAALKIYPPTSAIGTWLMKQGIKRKIKQYKKARKAAERTVKPFIEGYGMLRENLLEPLGENHDPHCCLLVHSLGHKVLKDAVALQQDLSGGYQFSKTMLHQADELDLAHGEWVGDLPMVANENTYITRNLRDSILFMSGIVNSGNPTKAFSRIGNRWDNDYVNDTVNYIDFTGMDGVGLEHGIAWDGDIAEDVEKICRHIITGEN